MITSPAKVIPIVANVDVNLYQSHGDKVPDTWQSRRLYIGEKGAIHWLEIVHSPKYPLHEEDHYELRKNRRAAIRDLPVQTMISLGPGDAGHDIEIVEELQTTTSSLCYIPVDISAPLLSLAIDKLRTRVEIPAAVLCDFEQPDGILKKVVQEFANRPLLISLLGGTIGNLDLGEAHFLNQIKRCMNQEDHLLIDVPLVGAAWSAERDPRLQKTEYTPEFRRFLSAGLERFEGHADEQDLSDLDSRIDCSLERNSSIEGTKVIKILDTLTGRCILQFCRYDWDHFVDWVESQHFQCLYKKCSLVTPKDEFGMGVVLLARS